MFSKGLQNDTNQQHKFVHMGSTPPPFTRCVKKNIRFGGRWLPLPEDMVVVMIVGVEMVVKMFFLVTLTARMRMLVRICPTVLLQVIY